MVPCVAAAKHPQHPGVVLTLMPTGAGAAPSTEMGISQHVTLYGLSRGCGRRSTAKHCSVSWRSP